MIFFCPLDDPRKPIRTTLAEQQADLVDGERKRHGLVVDAASPRAASATLESYLIDCHRSGRPGYAPSVDIEDREDVPVAILMDAHVPTADDLAAIDTMVAAAKRRMGKPVPMPAIVKHIAISNHCTLDTDQLSGPV